MSARREDITYRMNLALLLYISVVILFITLAPFRFAFSPDFIFSSRAELQDVLNNLVLFFPFGFILGLSGGQRMSAVRVLLIAGLFSSTVEALQIFLPGRFTAPVDVLSNSAGAWMGYLLLRHIGRRRWNGSRVFVLDLPLMHLIYLMTPLIWLSSLSTGTETHRLFLLFLPGAMGAIILVEIYRHRARSTGLRGALLLGLATAGWFIGSGLPALFRQWRMLGGGGLLLGLGVAALCWRLPAAPRNRRFEIRVLKRILPLFTLFLFLHIYWPLQFPDLHLRISFGFPALGDDPSTQAIFRLLNYFSAITLLGYMVGELAGRWAGERELQSVWIVFFVLSMAAELELVRALHPLFDFSLLHLILAALGAMAGVQIYRLQLERLQFITRGGDLKPVANRAGPDFEIGLSNSQKSNA